MNRAEALPAEKDSGYDARKQQEAGGASREVAYEDVEDLVYQETRVPGSATSAVGEAPIGLEIGLGTRPVGTSRDFSPGNLRSKCRQW